MTRQSQTSSLFQTCNIFNKSKHYTQWIYILYILTKYIMKQCDPWTVVCCIRLSASGSWLSPAEKGPRSEDWGGPSHSRNNQEKTVKINTTSSMRNLFSNYRVVNLLTLSSYKENVKFLTFCVLGYFSKLREKRYSNGFLDFPNVNNQ
jgi:hypothetical protein